MAEITVYDAFLGYPVSRPESPEETELREKMQTSAQDVAVEVDAKEADRAAALTVVAERATKDPAFAALLELLK